MCKRATSTRGRRNALLLTFLPRGSNILTCLLLLTLFGGCSSFPDVPAYRPSLQRDPYKEALRRAAMAQSLKQVSQDAYVYRIHPTDIIEISVFEYEKMNLVTRVAIGGKINFPPLGEVQAAGLTQRELEEAIVKGLKGAYLPNPSVIVSVREATSRNVTILGEVKTPGQQAVWGETKLLEVLAKAGGLTPLAGNIAYLVRENPNQKDLSTTSTARSAQTPQTASPTASAASEAQTFHIYLAGLLQRGEKEWDIPVQPGDTLTVPPAGTVHVTGPCITKPGTYPLTFQPKTLTQFIDEAGGLTVGASRKIIFGRRTGPARDKFDFFWVNYKKAMQTPEYDLAMGPGDRIVVLPSFLRRSWERAQRIVLSTAVSLGIAARPISYGVGVGQDTTYMRNRGGL